MGLGLLILLALAVAPVACLALVASPANRKVVVVGLLLMGLLALFGDFGTQEQQEPGLGAPPGAVQEQRSSSSRYICDTLRSAADAFPSAPDSKHTPALDSTAAMPNTPPLLHDILGLEAALPAPGAARNAWQDRAGELMRRLELLKVHGVGGSSKEKQNLERQRELVNAAATILTDERNGGHRGIYAREFVGKMKAGWMSGDKVLVGDGRRKALDNICGGSW